MKKKALYLIIPLLIIVLLLAGFGLYGYIVAKYFMPNLSILQQTTNELKEAFQKQDLILAKAKTTQLAKEVDDFNNKYQKHAWISFIPLIGNYTKDVNLHLMPLST